MPGPCWRTHTRARHSCTTTGFQPHRTTGPCAFNTFFLPVRTQTRAKGLISLPGPAVHEPTILVTTGFIRSAHLVPAWTNPGPNLNPVIFLRSTPQHRCSAGGLAYQMTSYAWICGVSENRLHTLPRCPWQRYKAVLSRYFFRGGGISSEAWKT
jgi:hypothetical protein